MASEPLAQGSYSDACGIFRKVSGVLQGKWMGVSQTKGCFSEGPIRFKV